jgi:hypothetical protein
MKQEFYSQQNRTPAPVFTMAFTEAGLKEYYKSIRNNSEISDEFKLMIANKILDL